MLARNIQGFLNVKPFKPFVLKTSDGNEYRIVSTEMINVREKLDIVVVYPTDETLVMLSLDQITAAAYPAPLKAKRGG